MPSLALRSLPNGAILGEKRYDQVTRGGGVVALGVR